MDTNLLPEGIKYVENSSKLVYYYTGLIPFLIVCLISFIIFLTIYLLYISEVNKTLRLKLNIIFSIFYCSVFILLMNLNAYDSYHEFKIQVGSVPHYLTAEEMHKINEFRTQIETIYIVNREAIDSNVFIVKSANIGMRYWGEKKTIAYKFDMKNSISQKTSTIDYVRNGFRINN